MPDLSSLQIFSESNIAWAMLGVILLSGFYGWVRGGLREIYGLIVICSALFGAWVFGPIIIPASVIETETIRTTTGTIIVVVVLGLGLTLLSGLISIISTASASTPSRILGTIIGLGRGVVICAFLTSIILSFSTAPENWRQQATIRFLENTYDQARKIADSEAVSRILFDSRDTLRDLGESEIEQIQEELVKDGS